MNAEQKKLKEAMKILLRDGKKGRLFEAAKKIFLANNTSENINALAHELDGVDWTKAISEDLAIIAKMIN